MAGEKPSPLTKLSHPPSKNPHDFVVVQDLVLPCDFWLPSARVCDSHLHESARPSGLAPLLPPDLPLPGEVGEDRGREERLAEDICQAFPWLARTTGCLEAHLQPCPSPFLFPAGSSSSKTSLISPGARTRTFNGSLLKQMF